MTYSIGTTGRRADFTPAVPQVLQVDDATAGRPADQQIAMSTNAQVLCKNRDGSESYYTIDQERSREGALVMLKV